MPKYSAASKSRLVTCDPDLQYLFNQIIKDVDCSILCGYRGEVEQTAAFNSGNSKLIYPKSYHNKIPSLAVDAAPYPIDWNDKERFIQFGGYVLGRASVYGIYIVWGGNWKTFKDYPHFQKGD